MCTSQGRFPSLEHHPVVQVFFRFSWGCSRFQVCPSWCSMFHPTMLEQLDGPWLWLCSSTMDQHVCVADVQSSMVALAHSEITGITTQFHQPPVRWSWMILGCLPLWSHHLWWSHGEVVVIHKYIYIYVYIYIRIHMTICISIYFLPCTLLATRALQQAKKKRQ